MWNSGISFNEFLESCNSILQYNWDDEIQDFLYQLQDEEAVRGHVFWDMFVLHNVLRVLSGEKAESFDEVLDEGNPFDGATFYRCNEEKCRAICTRPDVMPVFPPLEDGDMMPAGLCPVCGGYVSQV